MEKEKKWGKGEGELRGQLFETLRSGKNKGLPVVTDSPLCNTRYDQPDNSGKQSEEDGKWK